MSTKPLNLLNQIHGPHKLYAHGMLLVRFVCDWCGEFNAPLYAYVCAWRVHSLRMPWELGGTVDWDPKVSDDVGVLQCKTVFYVSSDITCDMVLLILYTILLNKATEDLLRYTAPGA